MHDRSEARERGDAARNMGEGAGGEGRAEEEGKKLGREGRAGEEGKKLGRDERMGGQIFRRMCVDREGAGREELEK